MSYQVLARKWRPQNFEEVVGQPHVTKTLQNAVRSRRLAHAYLFTGARGVGKTSVARILAKSINCEGATDTPPCNECSNCREITQGNSVDVLEIDGASNRGIDSIRELRETVRYRPAKSRYKIYIIDEVHMLTTEAFNALLKTLEEPPEHVLFVFATTEPHKILSTILSRCQRFDFRRIAMSEIVTHLSNILSSEQARVSEEILFAIAREADGSMRDAQSLVEQLLAFSGEGLSDAELLDVLGVVDRRSVHEVGRAILDGNVRGCLSAVDDLYRRGIDSRRFCQHLCDHFRNLYFCTLQEGDDFLRWDLPVEEKQLLLEEASRSTPETLYVYFQMLLKSEETIRRASLPKIALEMLLVRLARIPQLESLDRLLEKLDALQVGLGGEALSCPRQQHLDPGPAAQSLTPRVSSKPPEFSVPPVIQQLGEPKRVDGLSAAAAETSRPAHANGPRNPQEGWTPFLGWLQSEDPVLHAKLLHSRVAAYNSEEVELEVAEVFEDALKDPRTLDRLSNLAHAYMGVKSRWVITRKGPTPLTPKDGRPEAGKTKINVKRMVMEHPVVQQALEVLGGELVDIRGLRGNRES